MKHHFGPWSDDLPEGVKPGLDHGDRIAYSKWTRCGVPVKCRLSTSFWVNGKWTSKRPPCQPAEKS